jgi:hypothetical protein
VTPADWAAVVGGGGALGIIGVLLRISYHMGVFVAEFRSYVNANDAVVDRLDKRVVSLETRRR